MEVLNTPDEMEISEDPYVEMLQEYVLYYWFTFGRVANFTGITIVCWQECESQEPMECSVGGY